MQGSRRRNKESKKISEETVTENSPNIKKKTQVQEAQSRRQDKHKEEQDLVQFSCSIMSNSLQPHGMQHARTPCPSPTPRVYSNSCPLSRWCHPTISSSVIPLSSCLQSFPTSGSFEMSQLFASGGQSIAVSASASVLPMNIQDWLRLRWTDGISRSPRKSQESSPIPQFKSIRDKEKISITTGEK